MSALSDPPTMAFLCRTDLNLSAGKLAVQCAHAAVASLQRAKKTHSRMVQRWKESASRKICLAVDDEEEIEYFLNLVEGSITSICTHQRCWADRGRSWDCNRSRRRARSPSHNGFLIWRTEDV